MFIILLTSIVLYVCMSAYCGDEQECKKMTFTNSRKCRSTEHSSFNNTLLKRSPVWLSRLFMVSALCISYNIVVWSYFVMVHCADIHILKWLQILYFSWLKRHQALIHLDNLIMKTLESNMSNFSCSLTAAKVILQVRSK